MPLMVKDLLRKPMEAAGNRWLRLFIKNTGLCEHVSGCIGSDACPVPEG
jgi:hypothetical protein